MLFTKVSPSLQGHANSQAIAALFLAASASAAALPVARETCAYQCASVCYYQSDIDAAVAKGYELYQEGALAGEYD